MIWSGILSAISQLASRVGDGGEGELGKILSISLHYLAQGERQEGGVAFPPLALVRIRPF